jgi:uncharacterized protein YbjT (DUF2867 family)
MATHGLLALERPVIFVAAPFTFTPVALRLLVVGASGGTGRLLVNQALTAGHEVTALVRDTARLPISQPLLRVVVSDVMRPETLHIDGHDAVLCAIGTMPEAREDRPRMQRGVPVCSEGTRHLIEAMTAAGVRRLVVESSASVGASRRTGRLGIAWVMWRLLGDVMEDKERQEACVRASGLDWTIVRPVKLTDGAPTGRVRVAEDARWGWGRVSRADVAAVMLRCLSDPTSVGKALTIAPA